MKRAGVVRVTHEALAQALKLPRGHRVAGIVAADRDAVANGYVEVLLEGPLMPLHHEGTVVQIVELPSG